MDITCVGVTKMVFRPTVFQPEFKCLFFFWFFYFPENLYIPNCVWLSLPSIWPAFCQAPKQWRSISVDTVTKISLISTVSLKVPHLSLSLCCMFTPVKWVTSHISKVSARANTNISPTTLTFLSHYFAKNLSSKYGIQTKQAKGYQ